VARVPIVFARSCAVGSTWQIRLNGPKYDTSIKFHEDLIYSFQIIVIDCRTAEKNDQPGLQVRQTFSAITQPRRTRANISFPLLMRLLIRSSVPRRCLRPGAEILIKLDEPTAN